jgi:nitroreductase
MTDLIYSKPTAEITEVVDAAITTRRSMRAFLDTPVPQSLIEELLQVASRAPSGTNTQPWKVYVLAGTEKKGLSAAIQTVFNSPELMKTATEEYAYYPTQWASPYIDRRRKVGWDLYGLLEIGKTDKDKMHTQHGRNYDFFDAPIGLMFTIDRVMQQGSWLDYGMFLQNIMIAARARGLHTCPQAAFTAFHKTIAQYLDFPDHEMLVCGMSLGYADPSAIENSLHTSREPVHGFAQFRGF